MNERTTSARIIVGLACLFLAASAHAQVYRCIDAATKKVTFSDVRCPVSSDGESVRVVPNTLDTSGSREQALRREIQGLREEVREYREEATAPRSGRTQSDLQAERYDQRACDQAKWSYDIEAGSLKQNKAAIEAKRSAMYGACGMKEPDRVEVNVKNVQRGDRARGAVITSCDAGGCWDSKGGRYTRGAGSTFFSPNGACQQIGNMMQCP